MHGVATTDGCGVEVWQFLPVNAGSFCRFRTGNQRERTRERRFSPPAAIFPNSAPRAVCGDSPVYGPLTAECKRR
jgi:hypothetical protein